MMAARGPRGRTSTYRGEMRNRSILLALAMTAAIIPTVAPLTPALLDPASAAAAAQGCEPPASLAAAAAPPAAFGFHAIAPVRLLDTRESGGPVGAGCTEVLDLSASSASIPADAQAVALNVTAVDSALRGYVTVYPCGSPRPSASSVNPRTRGATANSALVRLDGTRKVCLFTQNSLNLVVDATGWFGRFGAPYHAIDSTRVLDTRSSLRPDAGTGVLPALTELRLPMHAGAVSDDARAVAVNVTTTGSLLEGYVTVYPCSSQRPPTSTVNFLPNDERANHTVVGLDVDGSICIWANVGVHVVVDVEGWFGGDPGSGTLFRPLLGTRVLDTREGIGGVTGRIGVNSTITFDPTAGGRLPLGSTVVLNVISTEADGRGYVALHPCSAPRPPTSAVNSVAGTEATNVAFVTVDATSSVCLFTSVPMHVVVDVIGTFGPGGPLHGLSIGGRTLGQTFSPDAHDYTTLCASGPNPLQVHAEGAPGTTVSIAGSTEPAPLRAAATADRTLTLNENDAVVVRAGLEGGAVEEYWVRCLPHDFPAIVVTTTQAPNPGWYLMDAAFPTSAGDQSRFLLILDERGVPVWYRRVPNPSIDFTRLSNGTLAWTKLQGLAFGSDPAGVFEIHALDGTLLRSIKTVSGPTDHHDIAELPNGDVILATYVPRHADLTALGAGFTNNELVYDGHLEEIRPDGTVAWTWKSEDHIPVTDTTLPLRFPGVAGSGVDLIHINSIHIAPDGDVIVSGRHTDTVYKIRRNATGDVVLRVGGKHSDVTFVNDPLGGFGRQHDVQLLANGHLRLFDNRTFLPGAPRAVEYALDTMSNTATLVWSFTKEGVVSSGGVGSVRGTGDGDIVVAWGGSTAPAFTEFDPDGNELQSTTVTGHYPYRVDKQPPTAFDIAVLRATAGR